MSNISIQYFKTPVGELVLGDYGGELCLCDWRYRRMREAVDQRIKTGLAANFVEVGDTPLLAQARSELLEYFDGKRTQFEVPLKLVGTEFQQGVWRALQEIPFGKTETYLGLSQQLGNEKAIRAVASANGANAISIIVPCHRIIGSGGELVGYAGGLDAKRRLLLLEGAGRGVQNGQLGLFEQVPLVF